jgi:hypothetical protein
MELFLWHKENPPEELRKTTGSQWQPTKGRGGKAFEHFPEIINTTNL